VPLALLPTNIQNCGCASLSSASGTFVFITEPSNLVLGIERNITFERWRDAPRHLTWLIWTIRFDALVFNEDATAMIDCMQLDTCGTACTPEGLAAGRCFSCINTGSGH
jgi:hypothetical protein